MIQSFYISLTKDQARALVKELRLDRMPHSSGYTIVNRGIHGVPDDYLSLRLDPHDQPKGYYLKSGRPPYEWKERYGIDPGTLPEPEPVQVDHDSWGTW